MNSVKQVPSISTIKIKPVPPRETVNVKPVEHIVIESAPTYTGAYEVTPYAHNARVLETKDKKMLDNVTVKKIPYYSTSNEYGKTIYIASEV